MDIFQQIAFMNDQLRQIGKKDRLTLETRRDGRVRVYFSDKGQHTRCLTLSEAAAWLEGFEVGLMF